MIPGLGGQSAHAGRLWCIAAETERALNLATGQPVVALTPSAIADDWNHFFSYWVKPLLEFGTPALVVFAVLLAATRLWTSLLVSVEAKGPRSAEKWPRLGMRLMYLVGIGCLFWSSVEAAVMFPIGRTPMPVSLASSSSDVSIVLGSVGAATVLVLFSVTGHSIADPYDLCLEASLVAGAVLLVNMMGAVLSREPWLNGQPVRAAQAVLLAGLGFLITGRARGVGIGLVIRGHDKTGADDVGLGAFVRARLHALGGAAPSGIQITQQTDVSTLSGDTLGLLPEGILNKLGSLALSLFKPATPWGVDVWEQADGSVIVSIRRNGKLAAAEVIRSRELWLPQRLPGADTPADWTAELRIAAAAFILLTLSERYAHLKAGLVGATAWRSVALQVIAADRGTHLSDQDRHDLLVRTEALDCGNRAVRLARLFAESQSATDPAEVRRVARKLSGLLTCIRGDMKESPSAQLGLRPLEMRLRFNLLAAWGNYASSFEPEPREDSTCWPADTQQALARYAIKRAAKQAIELRLLFNDGATQKACPDLCEEMECAAACLAWALTVEWRGRFTDPFPEESISDVDPLIGRVGNVNLLTRYEHACGLVPRIPGESDQERRYSEALNELEAAVVQPAARTWARSDPSFASLHDVDKIMERLGGAGQAGVAARVAERFKLLIGEPVPPDFLALAPLAGHRDALERCGIHTATDLSRTPGADLIADLGIVAGEAVRLLELAHLHRQVQGVTTDLAGAQAPAKREQRVASLLYLLLRANLDTATAVRDAARSSADDLKKALIDLARPWAVAAPGWDEISRWRDFFLLLPPAGSLPAELNEGTALTGTRRH